MLLASLLTGKKKRDHITSVWRYTFTGYLFEMHNINEADTDIAVMTHFMFVQLILRSEMACLRGWASEEVCAPPSSTDQWPCRETEWDNTEVCFV